MQVLEIFSKLHNNQVISENCIHIKSCSLLTKKSHKFLEFNETRGKSGGKDIQSGSTTHKTD